jgi:hypothetical protein
MSYLLAFSMTYDIEYEYSNLSTFPRDSDAHRRRR